MFNPKLLHHVIMLLNVQTNNTCHQSNYLTFTIQKQGISTFKDLCLTVGK